ncbi:hypothetical protein Mapa_017485 [Marchantia paleacea]|nr:hypothetical protein Mapa_017485 [Marchantia paleacea]
MATAVNIDVVSRTCSFLQSTADPGYQPISAALMIHMASEIKTRLVDQQTNEWVENGYTVSGDVRCIPGVEPLQIARPATTLPKTYWCPSSVQRSGTLG